MQVGDQQTAAKIIAENVRVANQQRRYVIPLQMISPKILCRILQAVAPRAGVLMAGISSQGSAADIQVAWNHYIRADPVTDDSLRYRNKAGQEWSVKQLSYLISGLSLQREYFWDGRSPSLRDQALIPIQDHRELDESLDNIVAKLTQLNTYPSAFERALGSSKITAEKIGLAVENFLSH
jgi:hypothetical protein